MTSRSLQDVTEGEAFDVVVIGAGGAGMAAALFAAISGLKVILIEHTGQVGGSTAYSAGSAWIPNTSHAATVGAQDSIENAALYLRHSVGNQSSESMRHAFLANGPDAVAELEAHSEVKFRARPLHPDYNSQLPGSSLKGRVLEAAPYDGRDLKDLLTLIREPIPEFMILGGMMVNQEDVLHLLNMLKSFRSFRHSVRILARHALDRLRHPRGTRLMMGNALVARLLVSLHRRHVPILMNASVAQVESGADGVSSVTIRQNDVVRAIRIRGGLVAATGGFSRHPARRAEMLRKPVAAYCPGAPGHTGQLHDLLLKAGARYGTDHRDTAFWSPVSVRARADGSTAVFPHFIFDRGRPGTITVNGQGRRFVNEALSYHPFTQAMFEANETAPSIPAFLITDEDGLRKYGLGMVRPSRFGRAGFLKDGYLVSAPTLAELAGRLEIDPAALTETVARFNGFAASGIDPDFGRGGTDYQRITAGDLSHKPNPCLGPIARAPFYAVRLYPGDIGAATGLVTDEDARVLRDDGSAVGRLYACGNDMNSVMGGNYPGPGITIGPGLVFSYIAVRHIVDRLRASGEDGPKIALNAGAPAD
ncbi:MAG: Fumarate reductase/succinate dehydrogenase flavoprotein [Tardiphaga sp.]|nr:Fumarate reductase/succinate dehydrogenase flavoprotein [Tardiphaga sp.]